MLSQTVEYALRAVVQLAYHQPQLCSTSEIAEKTCVPAAYLSKVLQNLVKAGIVTSQRGVGGGMTLRVPAEKLTLLDVVNAVDPIRRINHCPLNIDHQVSTLCPLHTRLDKAMALIEESFAATTLAEIVAERSNCVPLCEVYDAPPVRGLVALTDLRG